MATPSNVRINFVAGNTDSCSLYKDINVMSFVWLIINRRLFGILVKVNVNLYSFLMSTKLQYVAASRFTEISAFPGTIVPTNQLRAPAESCRY